jgi:hypothetical protein
MNGNVHIACPRCRSDWDQLDGDSYDYFICTNERCSMMACMYDPNTIYEFEFVLSVDVFDDEPEYQPFIIYWYDKQCLITKIADSDDGKDIDTVLPLLPFDITFEKLKTYLIFS